MSLFVDCCGSVVNDGSSACGVLLEAEEKGERDLSWRMQSETAMLLTVRETGSERDKSAKG